MKYEINEFIRLANTDNLKFKEVQTQIMDNNREIIGDYFVTVSFDKGNKTNFPWVSVSRYEGYKEDGPVFLYYKTKNVLILSLGIKEETTRWNNEEIDSKYDFKWNDILLSNYQTIEDFFGEQVGRYGNSYVFKSYEVREDALVDGSTIDRDLVELLNLYSVELSERKNKKLTTLVDYIKTNYNSYKDKHEEEIKNERDEFLRRFPLSEFKNMTLDQYSQTGNYESFTNYIENKTSKICSGSLGVNQNKLFFPKDGVYTTLGPVNRWYSDFNTIEEKFEQFKKEMYEFVSEFNIDTYDNIDILKFRANIIKFKTLRLYRPDVNLYGLPSYREISKILKHLELEHNPRGDDSITQNIVLTRHLLTEFPEITNWNTDIINQLIWDYKIQFIDSAQNVEEQSEEETEDGETSMQVRCDKNLILYGPPGTGKTYNSKIYAVAICDELDVEELKEKVQLDPQTNYKEILDRYDELVVEKRICFTTFHQSYGYEEFIEGIHPELNESNQVFYQIKSGVFKEFCEQEADSEGPRVYIIDEINRGNISKIFGELITLIETTKRDGQKEAMSVILPYSNKPFSVPNNIHILGTMNTADRSIALMDTALRRRFAFEEMMPETLLLKDIYVDGLNVGEMLKVINERIEVLYDREHTIGHSYFMDDGLNLEKLAHIFKNKIIPLLQEYFYEDYEKIQWVLGDNAKTDDNFKFIKKIKNERSLFKGHFDDSVIPEYRYEINEDAFNNIESYIQII